MVALICSEEEKALSSRDGMRRTVESSPFYNGWVEAAAADLEKARAALLARDLERLGAAMERNAFRMHASAMGAVPPVLYMRAATLAAYEAVLELRRRGTGAWFTLDAGPNPLFLCLASDAERVAEVAGEAAGARRRIFCTVGGAVERLAEEGR